LLPNKISKIATTVGQEKSGRKEKKKRERGAR